MECLLRSSWHILPRFADIALRSGDGWRGKYLQEWQLFSWLPGLFYLLTGSGLKGINWSMSKVKRGHLYLAQKGTFLLCVDSFVVLPRFLILPWIQSKNLASKLLSLISKRLPQDWNNKYNYKPVLLETFVEIPMLREDTCSQLRIKREIFDTLFIKYYSKHHNKIELSGAPTITTTKTSPINIKTTQIVINGESIELDYNLEKERKGISLHGKNYFYCAIFK